MKLAVSSIAWTNEEEADVASLLQRLGVSYVELAPTKQWQDPTTEASDKALADYKAFWAEYGIKVVAFQSMLFNRPDLKLFDTPELRKESLDYLQKFITLAPKLGAGVMVFGSPKNRQRAEMPLPEATKIAQEFFEALGDTAQQNNTIFCIEPNPTAYACDFLVNSQEGIDLVKAVGNPGFGLHLDIAGMTLAGDDIRASITDAGRMIQHFHISAPYLGQVEERDDVDYRLAAQALADIGYSNYLSIEMRPEAAGENLARVEKAVRFAQETFAIV
jgi:D-psicose/D-tagatose/L-ribulose 3-epimerase